LGSSSITIAIMFLAGPDELTNSGMQMSILSDIWDTPVRVASAVTELFLPGHYVLVCPKSLDVHLAALSPLP
ncbi:hypothetical protein, partial [Klebsiella pneumoniae]|uniref:hypothetical protein n=1 Tax=Klebsiella pneumoniae TaxID=573 RepID=UPI001B8C0B0D